MTLDTSHPMERDAAFPSEMQGRWIEADEPSPDAIEVTVKGSEITWRGAIVDYGARRIRSDEEVVWVEVEFPDQSDEGDAINLIVTPEGEMHAFNDHFATRFVRADA